ncbi:hypothetical protein J3D56_002257 [Erwinia persicina]|uniref:hypothetical protein n=1 Tax=Erwinia persicina TaxID=55211 RepID=UPI00209E13EC|nr:hypothetical protein [Erwinia persicina]MCP1438821.1 hypothetical protein [Erwinia persicina]
MSWQPAFLTLTPSRRKGLAVTTWLKVVKGKFGKRPGGSRHPDDLVGPEKQSVDAMHYPGVIYSPLPVGLTGPKKRITQLTGNRALYK